MFNEGQDQAAGLRRIMAAPKPRIFSMISASNPEDQTKLIINLGTTLNRQGADVLVIHAGEDHPETIKQYDIQGLDSLMDKANHNYSCHAIKQSAHGFTVARLLPKRKHIGHFSEYERHGLNSLVANLSKQYEVMLVDAAMSADRRLPLDILNQNEIVIHLNQKPDSITMAYSYIKLICSELGRRPFNVLIDEANPQTAQTVFDNIQQVAKRYMQVELNYIGFIPADDHSKRATKLGRTVVDAFPSAQASLAIRQLAAKIDYRQALQTSMLSI